MGGPDFDVVIVGAGAGGGVAAWVLASAGLRVAVLEKGRNPFPHLGEDRTPGNLLGNDEVRRRRHYAFHDPLAEPRTFRDGEAGDAAIADVQGLGVCVGGGTVQYDGDSPRMQRQDFEMRSRWGEVAGASVVDWPFGYDELAPYYDLAEQAIGVQGEAGADPFAEPRGPYPMPPGTPSLAGRILSRGASDLGLHPHPMPMAINSMRYRGRPACARCGFCAAGCGVHAKGSTAVTVIHDALRTGNLTLLSECCALRVETDSSGEMASAVVFLDGQGQLQRVVGRQIVLASNAIETPRLLLASASSAHPNGLGNAAGLVGRFLCFHMIFGVVGVFDREIRSYRGPPVTHAMADWTMGGGGPNPIRGGYVELGGSIHPVDEGVSYPWLLHGTLIRQGQWRRRIATATMIGEDVPVANNRVDLDPAVRDIYGRPVARITYSRHPHDQLVVDHFMPRLRDIVLASGAVDSMDVDFAVMDGWPQTRHLLGTTRMGLDPATSVCDPWGRVHGVENLWIADGGVFPTSTAWNPTLTQQALAWRTAERIVAETGE